MLVPCEAVDFRAGRQAGRAICFTLLKVLVGIPGNSAPRTTQLLPEQEKERERPAKNASKPRGPSCHSAPLTELHARFSAVSPCPCSCAVRTPASHLNTGASPQVNQRMTKTSAAGDAKATCDENTGYCRLWTTRGAARKLVARVMNRHMGKVAGAQGARERPLRPP